MRHRARYRPTHLCALLALKLTLAGCASVTTSNLAAGIGADSLLAGAALAEVVVDRPDVEADVLASSPQMRAFIDQHVDRGADDYIQLRQLVYAVIGEGTFDLEYGQQTLTAVETFDGRRGNCLSFTNMFVAMARAIGLQVAYQEVDIPPDWTTQEGTFVLSVHVNVHIDLGRAGEHAVDFEIGNFRSTYDRRIISDDRALAHYHNNKGVENLQAGRTSAAFANLRRALELDSTFSPAWSNLGVLYRRQGLSPHAEASFLQALVMNPEEYVAVSNLANLYVARGDELRAAYFEDRATRHRMRNPYFRLGLARQAFLRRDYEEAIDHLEYAVRRREWEDSFYFLMDLCYLQLGDEEQARTWLEKAESVAENDARKRSYQSKIDLLLSAAPPD